MIILRRVSLFLLLLVGQISELLVENLIISRIRFGTLRCTKRITHSVKLENNDVITSHTRSVNRIVQCYTADHVIILVV